MCDMGIDTRDLEREGRVKLLNVGYWHRRMGGWWRWERVHFERRFLEGKVRNSYKNERCKRGNSMGQI